jgi:hypothetical protein
MQESIIWAQTISQIVLAAVGIWYAWETQRLRRIAREQVDVSNQNAKAMHSSLELTKASFDADLLPYLIMGIVLKSGSTASAISAESSLGRIALPAVGKMARKTEDNERLVFEVQNITEKIASHLLCIFFDRRNNHNYISSCILDAVGPQQKVFLPLQKEPSSMNDITATIKGFYEDRGEYLIEGQGSSSIIGKYATSDDSHVLVIFFDLAGKLYTIPRIVTTDETLSVFQFGKSDLIQPNSEWFAPTFNTTRKTMGRAG